MMQDYSPAATNVLSFLSAYHVTMRRLRRSKKSLNLLGRLGSDHVDLLISRRMRARILKNLSRYSEALTEIEDVIAISSESLNANHIEQLINRRVYARILKDLSRYDDARQEINDVVSLLEKKFPAGHADLERAKQLQQEILSRSEPRS